MQVDEVIGFFSKSAPTNFTANNLEMQIKGYVATQLRNGYSIDVIRQALLQQGFSRILVDKTINGSNASSVRRDVHTSGASIFWIFLAIAILGGLCFVLFFTDIIINKDLPVLDISIESSEYNYIIGGSLSYNINLVTTGSKKRVDANAKYFIIDQSDNIMKTSSQAIAVDTTTSSSGTISLEGLSKGVYTLKVVVDYGGASAAESSASFEIIDESVAADTKTPIQEVVIPPPKEQPEDIDDGYDYVIIDRGEDAPPTIIDNTPTDTFGDALVQIRTLAIKNPSSAANACSKFSSLDQKDSCYATVADSSKKYSYCEFIKSVDAKDNCYLAFIIYGKTEVCPKITDSEIKAYCEQVKLVAEMNAAYQKGDTAKIQELSKKFNPAVYNANIQPKKTNSTIKK